MNTPLLNLSQTKNHWQTMRVCMCIRKSNVLAFVYRSSSSHTWDAFQLAHASFSLYCIRNNLVLPDNSQKVTGKLGPHLLGEPPKIDVTLPEMVEGDDEESSPGALPAIKIYDDDVNMRFLVCGVACTLVSLDGYLLLMFIVDGFSLKDVVSLLLWLLTSFFSG